MQAAYQLNLIARDWLLTPAENVGGKHRRSRVVPCQAKPQGGGALPRNLGRRETETLDPVDDSVFELPTMFSIMARD